VGGVGAAICFSLSNAHRESRLPTELDGLEICSQENPVIAERSLFD
jgi:hypothetical protein